MVVETVDCGLNEMLTITYFEIDFSDGIALMSDSVKIG